jgi:pimeloyl-ACP methyl ester carboxylesterase
MLNGAGPLLSLADVRGWFVVSPKFLQEGKDVQDRKKSYYYPERFSGKAVLDAFEQIAREYPVDTEHILMQGLSGGAQFVHRFALWAPERVVAVAVNSSSWFDEPDEKSIAPAFLITVGDSDSSYDNSLQFVDQLRQVGATPLFRSYLAMLHEGDPRVNKLNEAFLTFYDDLTSDQLGKRISLMDRDNPQPSLTADRMPFVGDSLDWRYFESTEDNVADVPEDSVIFLPSEPIARLWGEE